MAQTELTRLQSLSARIGDNALLVQGPGGNTSLKRNGTMWIKASGTWLANAGERNIFVPLDFASLSKAISDDNPDCESCLPFVKKEINLAGLRPSIETSVHGLMPQAVVLHVHCVSTIAWAIQVDAEAKLQKQLAGFKWAFVPYARPGLQLSRAIKKVLKPDTNVLVLGNHGLVVAADTVDEAEELLRSAVFALQRPARTPPKANGKLLNALAKGTEYRIPLMEGAHFFALDQWAHSLGSRNVYYPDHVVFLGAKIPDDPKSKAPAIAIFGAGVLIHKDAGPAVEPMLRCLGDVFRRLDQGTPLNALTKLEVDQLLNWDAEKYRQKIKP